MRIHCTAPQPQPTRVPGSLGRPIGRRLWSVALCATTLALPSAAGDTVYTYDALGRLSTVTRPDGTLTTYTLDAAGNRTQVQEAMPPGLPPSISMPSSNSTGSYTVSWQAPTSGGAVANYQLYEATNAAFSGATMIYQAGSTSFAVSGRQSATYYYRVRGCNGIGCGPNKEGVAGVVVTALPAAPTGLSKGNPGSCGWWASWNAVSGATSYKFSNWAGGEETVYTTTINYSCPWGQDEAYKPKWVQACNAGGCGTKANFTP